MFDLCPIGLIVSKLRSVVTAAIMPSDIPVSMYAKKPARQ